MAMKNGWTTDDKNTAKKQDRFVNGGNLDAKHQAYEDMQEAKGQLSKKQMKAGRIDKSVPFKGSW